MRSSTRFAVAVQLLGMSAALPSNSLLEIDIEVKVSASDTYDYVIVGGGVTGLIVANRLTEDEKSGLPSPYTGKANRTDDPQSLSLLSKQVARTTTLTFACPLAQPML
jgi:hypothetical protein